MEISVEGRLRRGVYFDSFEQGVLIALLETKLKAFESWKRTNGIDNAHETLTKIEGTLRATWGQR